MKRVEEINEGKIGSRPSWDEYFMKIAIDVASRSSCLNVQAGSVIVSNNEVIATGYNGAPSPVKENCLATGCRKKNKGLDYETSLGCGECIGVHSEKNALGHLSKLTSGAINLYATIFPCHTCAKDLLVYSLGKVVFKGMYSEKEMNSTLDLFEEAGVRIYRLDLSPERVFDIDFNRPDSKFGVWSRSERKRIEQMMYRNESRIIV